jgi:nitroimidazol reductase NimA-like FMN-containing flavoprotein (pyridoxamine 5'-phosphate oxidase superfamily)
VGFNTQDGPQVLPVNYVFYQESIYFRTAAESAISRAMPDSRVAFEIDNIDELMQRGWSVWQSATRTSSTTQIF